MATIRFEPNVPVEVALKFASGKQVQSRIPEAPDQMMYTVCGDDTIYTPLHVAEQITQLGIKKMELISICKRQQGGVTRWEVKRVGDTATPALPAQRASSVPAGSPTAPLPATQEKGVGQPDSIAAPIRQAAPIAHTVISKIMASALIAAFDATQEAERYAHAHGVEFEFQSEDVRAIANTLFIQLSRESALISAPAKTNGGATWQQQ